MDHYTTLGVDRNATPDEIKKAYRKLASKHHPDRGGDTAEFQKIQTAYDVLGDPAKKQQYDMPQSFNNNQGFPGGFAFNGFNLDEILGHMFRQQQAQNRSQTYRTVLHVSLEQAYNGVEQALSLHTHQGPQVVKIQIPKGVQQGQAIRYNNILPDGSLLVEFAIQPHPKFERDGANLYSVHNIDVFDLVVGTTFQFTTISGKVLAVRIPAKTQPGAKLRLAKEGMPNNGDFGDQFILLKPYIPDTIDTRITDSILQSRNQQPL
jgi:curved DNA-binding protein